ncbi:MAG: hypothetical protein HY222_02315 [Thaumarchaeota archaeon]|nr:hypothetical protein [Nitrososphaerota archaeon]MBI3641208.1 hypothetical protein [Nitrososphaerota archaeon]
MRQKKLLYVGIGGAIATAIIIVIVLLPNMSNQSTDNTDQSQISPLDLSFSYEEANSNLRTSLRSHEINMSRPLQFFSQTDLNQYCHFFSDDKKQALVKFCTSTVLKDKSGNFLGNINMVGSTRAPGLVIAAIQSNPVQSNLNDVKTIFGAVINETTCDCWDKEKPRGYATLSDMIDAFRDFHIAGKKPNSTTHSVPLGSEHFEMELTTNANGYLWKLLVAR